MSFDLDDHGPLPAVYPRSRATIAAKDEIFAAVGDIRSRYDLTSFEIVWCLEEVFRSYSDHGLVAERGRQSEK